MILETFGALDTNAQANRLAHFMADWFDPDHKLDTVDHVRLTARLRAHVSQMKISAGEVMEILLPVVRRIYAQAVYEREAARIRDEDRRAQEVIEAKAEDTPTEDTPVDDTRPVREHQHSITGDTPTGDVRGSTPPALPVQEPVRVHRARSKSKARQSTTRWACQIGSPRMALG